MRRLAFKSYRIQPKLYLEVNSESHILPLFEKEKNVMNNPQIKRIIKQTQEKQKEENKDKIRN